MKKIFSLAVMTLVMFASEAAERVVYTINDAWQFSREVRDPEARNGWETVNIPHTWNVRDADDMEPGMYRGCAWYRKSIMIPAEQQGRHCIIHFEGANQELELYINGEKVGEHIGGYTRFCFDIGAFLKYGEENLFAIYLSNRHNPDIPPLSADFTFWGGIYRDVYLKFIDPVHIATDDYASDGVYVRTPQVSRESATFNVSTLLRNNSGKTADLIVRNVLRDAEGREVARFEKKVKLAADGRLTLRSDDLSVKQPRLWDIDDPYRYRLYTDIIDRKTSQVLDGIAQPVGFRWFSFDPEQGFFLNGRHRKLVGSSRHQDFHHKGNALQDEYHVQDVRLLKEMGGNYLRVSHYPQDPVVMELCDRLGIVTSVEIPVVNAVTESEAFTDNCLNMVTEMIRQDFNRPSVMIWCYMNEPLLRHPSNDKKFLEGYYAYIEQLARKLEARIREEDPSRYTMIAFHNSPHRYEKARLTEIPMILGWNHYQGWYGAFLGEFETLVDRAHGKYPGKVLMVTEYGPGVDPRVHSFAPQRYDFSQEYGLVYHRHYMKVMLDRPFIAGSALWNFNDFYSEGRIDTAPNVNKKGVVSLFRQKKDTYLFYSALLSKGPFLKIGNRDWQARGGYAENGICMQSVPVFTNAGEVELKVNGRSLGTMTADTAVVHFNVPFRDGENVIEARAEADGKVLEDVLYVDFRALSSDMSGFEEMSVMLGSERYFDDRYAHVAWIPEKEYSLGTWGYVGGEQVRRQARETTVPGTDRVIAGTVQNPIFQTQRVGIESFKADVPDGMYSVYLYWAEFDTKVRKETLAYNLGADDNSGATTGERVFDLSINGVKCLSDFNIAKEYGALQAVTKKFVVEVRDGRGISIDFTPKEGRTILNAVRIYRNY